MVFNNPIKVDQLAVDVVQHFDFGLVFQKVNGGRAAERLDIASMFRKHRNDMFGKTAFAAHPRNNKCEVSVIHNVSLF